MPPTRYRLIRDDKEYWYLSLSGERFSPWVTEKALGLRFSSKIEKREPYRGYGKKSPLFGKVSPVGSAFLQPSKSVARDGQCRWLLRRIQRYHVALREMGAEAISLWQERYFPPDSQENYELSVDSMRILVEADVAYCLSVYHDSKARIAKMPERLF